MNSAGILGLATLALITFAMHHLIQERNRERIRANRYRHALARAQQHNERLLNDLEGARLAYDLVTLRSGTHPSMQPQRDARIIAFPGGEA